MPVFGAGVAGIEVVGVDGAGGVRVAGGVVEGELEVVERRARAPREREEVSGVGLVLGLCRNQPVHGEPRARQRRRDWAAAIGWVLGGFGARVSFTGVGRGCW